MSKLNHTHCNHFCPIDGTKGQCQLSGNIIMNNDPRCRNFSERLCCRHCYHFCDATVPALCSGLTKLSIVDADTHAEQCNAFKPY
ncbi:MULTISPECIES: 4-hydroxyphenylacetate decarboxylase small subunit [Buttiauxella]